MIIKWIVLGPYEEKLGSQVSFIDDDELLELGNYKDAVQYIHEIMNDEFENRFNWEFADNEELENNVAELFLNKPKDTTGKTFIDLCVEGSATADQIDDYIDVWYLSASSAKKVPLNEFLGMTKVEYGLWLKYPDCLKDIIEIKKQEKSG